MYKYILTVNLNSADFLSYDKSRQSKNCRSAYAVDNENKEHRKYIGDIKNTRYIVSTNYLIPSLFFGIRTSYCSVLDVLIYTWKNPKSSQ